MVSVFGGLTFVQLNAKRGHKKLKERGTKKGSEKLNKGGLIIIFQISAMCEEGRVRNG